jgi:hypothetical protein
MSESNTKVIQLAELNELNISSGKKLFPADKNYILKEVQLNTQNELLIWLIDYVKEYYETFHNPLGLVDHTIETIRSATFNDSKIFQDFYNDLAGIYRFKHGETQLAFLFDGNSHYAKYKSEWKVTFMKWVTQLLANRVVMRAFLEITVFGVERERQLELVLNRLKLYVEQYFQLKIYKYRGIQEVNVA